MLALVETVFATVAALVCAGIIGFNALTFAVAFARPPRPRRLARAFFGELLANFALIPAWPLFALLGARYEATLETTIGGHEGQTRKRRPVILLHGYMMNRTNWLWLGRVLARRGIGPLYGLSYYTLTGTERAARKLERFIEKVAAREGAEQVDIVAHSLGGLVARRYIERLGGSKRVRRLVTIATPHRGTAWGRIALGGARPDLSPARPTNPDGRADHIGPPEGVLYTSIWSRCDNLVIPPESAGLTPRPPEKGHAAAEDKAGNEFDDVVFDDLGHLALLVSPRVADAVATRLSA